MGDSLAGRRLYPWVVYLTLHKERMSRRTETGSAREPLIDILGLSADYIWTGRCVFVWHRPDGSVVDAVEPHSKAKAQSEYLQSVSYSPIGAVEMMGPLQPLTGRRLLPTHHRVPTAQFNNSTFVSYIVQNGL